MNFKLGRNAPCWCNSGKKYKHCHLDRDKEAVVSNSEAIDQLHHSFGRRHCLHPLASRDVCKGGIVQAHSIQRSGGLSRIARDGHVYRFTGDLPNLIRSSGQLEPELIGVKKASTFTGFCAYHDNVTFASLEKAPFEPTVEQIFQLSYRPVCRELFTKQSALSLMPFLHTLDRGRDFATQLAIQELANLLQAGHEAGLRDIEYQKGRYDDALVRGDYSELRHYLIFLSHVPDIMCSGATQFSVDFEGNVLQDLIRLDRRPDSFSFSLIGIDNGGVAAFSWLDDSKAGVKFIRSLDKFSDSEIMHAVVRLVFEFFENSYFAPNWWEALPTAEKAKLAKRMRASADPTEQPNSNCLLDDGMRVVAWTVRDRISNVTL